MSAIVDSKKYLEKLENDRNELHSSNESQHVNENFNSSPGQELTAAATGDNDLNENVWPWISESGMVEKNFQAICIDHATKAVYLSSTDLKVTSSGGVHKFASIDDIPNNCDLTIDMKQSLCKGLLFNEKYRRLIAGYNSGAIIIFDDQFKQYRSLHSHDDYVTELTLDPIEKRILASSSVDCSLNVWDIETSLLTNDFQYAHAASIMGIDFRPNSDKLLLSCGLDNLILNWDLRQPKASSKYASLTVSPTTIKWSKYDENIFFIGTNAGLLIKFDSRQLANDLGGKKLSTYPINKMKFINYYEKALGLCMANNFTVINENTFENIFTGKSSEQTFITDFIEFNDSVYTIGHNSKDLVNYIF